MQTCNAHLFVAATRRKCTLQLDLVNGGRISDRACKGLREWLISANVVHDQGNSCSRFTWPCDEACFLLHRVAADPSYWSERIDQKRTSTLAWLGGGRRWCRSSHRMAIFVVSLPNS